MKITTFIVFVFLFLLSVSASAQKKSKQVKTTPSPEKRYTQADVLDSIEGITLYNKFIPALLGDSLRYSKAGALAQKWQEDYYSNGKLLHKGLYKDGQLELFTNYYENGKVERKMAAIDSVSANVDMFYENGNQRRQINYYKGIPKKRSEFYTNGLLKSSDTYETKDARLLSSKTWYESGQISSELSYEPKTKKYLKKTYHPNGKLFESGSMVLSKEQQLVKTGTWTILDENGKNKKFEKH